MALDIAGTDTVSEQDIVLRDVPLVGGVRNDISPRHIADNQLVEGLNVNLRDESRPCTRAGYRELPLGASGLANGLLRGSGLAELDTGVSSRLFIAAFPGKSGGIYYAIDPDDASGWREALVTSDSTGDVSRSLDVSTDNCKMFQGNNLEWILTGATVHVLRPDGTIIDTGGKTTSPPIGAVDGDYMLSRVWMMSGDRLYWSKLLPSEGDLTPDPNAFDRTNTAGNGGGFITLSPNRSATPVATTAWRDESLICWFSNHIEEVVVNSADPLLSTRNIVSTTLGCGARDSIVSVGDELYFMDQYGQYRALRRNRLGALEGVIPEAISESFKAELPDNVNAQALRRTQAFLLEERIFVLYPRGNSRQPNAAMIYHTPSRRIEGPWVFNRPFSKVLVSDLGSRGYVAYSLDGSSDDPVSRAYRLFRDARDDDGVAISYRETGKAHTLGVPETNKRPFYFDLEVTGDVGATAELFLRTNENDDFVKVGRFDVAEKTPSSFPLLASDFPVVRADFPLIGSIAKLTTKKTYLTEEMDSEIQLFPGDLPLESDKLPVVGLQESASRGRVVQWRVQCDTLGKRLERVGLRVACIVDNVDRETEP